jgi:hypothetical protein
VALNKPTATLKGSGRDPEKGCRKDEEAQISSFQNERVQIYVAVFRPRRGNRYHWAVAIYDSHSTTIQWHVCDAIRQRHTGPFRIAYRDRDPRNSSRCLQPLIRAGRLNRAYLGDIIETIGSFRAQNNVTLELLVLRK